MREAVRRAAATPEQIDGVIMGNVLSAGMGQAPARQCVIKADFPVSTGAVTINKVCGSGLQAVMYARREILVGDADAMVAGGMESMTNAPYILPKARGGLRMGNGEIVDTMIADGLWDPYDDMHMGVCGDMVAEKYGFTREAQDEFASSSPRSSRCLSRNVAESRCSSTRTKSPAEADSTRCPACVQRSRRPAQ
jgi:acetyl-CoA C-acetyltransferase